MTSYLGKVGVIGGGEFGVSLASRLLRRGVEVAIAARSEQATRDRLSQHKENDLSAVQVGNLGAVVRAADLLVLALPYHIAYRLARRYPGFAAGRALVDATNSCWPRDLNSSDRFSNQVDGAIELARALPYVRLAKAFNTLSTKVLDSSASVVVPIATDDAALAETTVALCNAAGLQGMWIGPLRLSRALEAKAYIDMMIDGRITVEERS